MLAMCLAIIVHFPKIGMDHHAERIDIDLLSTHHGSNRLVDVRQIARLKIIRIDAKHPSIEHDQVELAGNADVHRYGVTLAKTEDGDAIPSRLEAIERPWLKSFRDATHSIRT